MTVLLVVVGSVTFLAQIWTFLSVRDFQCVVVGYNTVAVLFPQCDRTFTNQLKAGDVLKRQQGTTLSLQPLHF